MENPEQNICHVAFAEMMGTAVLIMGVNWGANSPDKDSWACVALSLFAGISIFGKISGNFNPAVSTAIFIARTTRSFNYNLKVYIITIMS